MVVSEICGMPPPFSSGGLKTYENERRKSVAVRSSAYAGIAPACITLNRRTSSRPMM